MARQAKGITLPIIYKADLKGLKDAEGGLEKFGRVAGRIGAAAAAALGAVVVSGVKMAIDLETSFAKIEGLVGITGQELDKLREAAKRLGPETGKSAQDAADALFVVTSAGLRGTDAINALELALKASTAGLGETEDIARAVSGAMNAYGSDVVDAARATDVIVATARAGNFETSQFAAAIGRVLPFAQQAGASLEDMGGAVALLTRTNGDAAQSVTQVSALFRAFVVPTEQAKKALENVGMSAQDMRDAIAREGLPAALDMLDEKLGGNREELGRLLGSSEAASAAFQILEAEAGTIAETFGVVNEAAGMTEESFGVMEDTVGFKAAKAFETFKGIMLDIGDAVLPVVTDILDDLAPVIKDAADGIADFIATDLGPWIDELQANEEFQSFLTDMKDTFAELVPNIATGAIEVAKLGTNIATSLQPAIENLAAGEDSILASMSSILGDINFFLGEINKIEMPGFNSGLEEMMNKVGLSMTPLGALRLRFKQIADAINAVRRAYERLKEAGIFSLGGTSGAGRAGGGVNAGEGGGRATGGSVMGGVSYLVGERGPELFVPRMSGDIVPTHRLGGGGNINIVVNAGMGTNGSEVGREIVAAIRRYERTSGRVFASA